MHSCNFLWSSTLIVNSIASVFFLTETILTETCPQASCMSPVGCWPTLPWRKPQAGSGMSHMMLAHSSLVKASSWVRLVGFLAITLVFKSRHKFSIGFRSGLWLGHSRTLTSLSLNHFFSTLAVYFASLSCWYFQLWPSWSFSADSFTFSSRVLM